MAISIFYIVLESITYMDVYAFASWFQISFVKSLAGCVRVIIREGSVSDSRSISVRDMGSKTDDKLKVFWTVLGQGYCRLLYARLAEIPLKNISKMLSKINVKSDVSFHFSKKCCHKLCTTVHSTSKVSGHALFKNSR